MLNRQLRRLGIEPPVALPGTRGVVAETLRTGRQKGWGLGGWLASLMGGGGAQQQGQQQQQGEGEEAAFLEARRRGLEVGACVRLSTTTTKVETRGRKRVE